MKLRPYQTDITDQARDLMRRGVRSILVQSPTGSGKTALTAHMLKAAAEKGLHSFFLVHRRELIMQSTRAFAKVGVHHGVIAAQFPADPRQRVQICSIGSLARRLDRVKKPKLLVWDECHHLAAGSWASIYKAFPDAFHVGLTATPERLDGKGLGDWFKHIINGPSVSTLIEQGFLSPYRLFAPGGGFNLEGLKTRMGDYIKSELNAVVDKPTITGDAIREYQKACPGKRAVVFAVSIEHSEHVVAQFNAAGIRAEHVDGNTPTVDRDAAIRRFENGDTMVLSNVDLFGEGFDVPAIEAVIDLAPTQSLGRYLQRCGRALRPAIGKKEAIILDHAGNCTRHGLPDDQREWSLEGRASGRGKSDTGPSIKVCPRCFAAQFSGLTVCKNCGYGFPIEPRKIEAVEGELTEIDLVALRRNRAIEQGRAETQEELAEVGKLRGYKNYRAWAKHVFNARQAKKLAGR